MNYEVPVKSKFFNSIAIVETMHKNYTFAPIVINILRAEKLNSILIFHGHLLVSYIFGLQNSFSRVFFSKLNLIHLIHLFLTIKEYQMIE